MAEESEKSKFPWTIAIAIISVVMSVIFTVGTLITQTIDTKLVSIEKDVTKLDKRDYYLDDKLKEINDNTIKNSVHIEENTKRLEEILRKINTPTQGVR